MVEVETSSLSSLGHNLLKNRRWRLIIALLQTFTSDSGEARAKEAQCKEAGKGNGRNCSDGHQVAIREMGELFSPALLARFRATADQQQPALASGGQQQLNMEMVRKGGLNKQALPPSSEVSRFPKLDCNFNSRSLAPKFDCYFNSPTKILF